MPYRPTQFQLTVIKPYYKDNSSKPVQNALKNALKDILEDALKDALEDTLEDAPEENYNKHALKGDYNKHAPEGNYDSDTIVVDMPQL